jgi:hypothetical protein
MNVSKKCLRYAIKSGLVFAIVIFGLICGAHACTYVRSDEQVKHIYEFAFAASLVGFTGRVLWILLSKEEE